MTWPSSGEPTTGLDAGTDTPPRAVFLSLVQKFNQLIAHVSTFMQGLLESADAAAARATLDVPTRAGGNATGDWSINAVNVTGIVARANGGTGANYADNAALFTGIKQAASATATGVVELATDAEAQAGTDATRAVTPDNLGATVLGIGQTWQNVIGSRAASTNYTNSTGRPILVAVSGNSGYTPGSASMTMTVGGVVVATRSTNESSGASYQGSNGSISAVIPNGAVYRVDGITGSLSISHWAELRT